jgi:predicted nucleotidyltransferase
MRPDIINKYHIPEDRIAEFCRRWKITQMALFGSILREDFSQESDIDVLVSFAPDSPWGLFELVDMQDELAVILGRKVDLVEREALRNPFRRKQILQNLEVVYEA